MRPDRPSIDRARLVDLAGYLLAIDVCYLIATSRWGSYAGAPQHSLYLTDVFFAACLLLWTLGRGPVLLWRTARRSPMLWVVLVIVGWAVIRLATGTISAVALRDAAPYVYLLGLPIAMTTKLSSRALVVMLVVAVAFHIAWLAVTLQGPSWYSSLPHLGPTRMFDLRDDYDETVAGIAVGVGVIGSVYASAWFTRGGALVLTGLAVWDISQMSNRGGILAIVACLLVAAVIIVARGVRGEAERRAEIVRASIGLALCVGAGIGVLQSPAVQRLNSTFDTNGPTAVAGSRAATPSSSPSSASPAATNRATDHGSTSASGHPSATSSPTISPTGATQSSPQAEANVASGTTAARKTAWRRVYRYTTATTTRALLGVGFGPDFLQAAGAEQLLSGGKPGLRAPHNILLNTWARLGLIGVLLQAALILLGLLAAARHALRRAPDAETGWVLVAIAVPTAAMVGVILEAPFGALPFAFALGRLYNLSSRSLHTTSGAGPAGFWRDTALGVDRSAREAGISP